VDQHWVVRWTPPGHWRTDLWINWLCRGHHQATGAVDLHWVVRWTPSGHWRTDLWINSGLCGGHQRVNGGPNFGSPLGCAVDIIWSLENRSVDQHWVVRWTPSGHWRTDLWINTGLCGGHHRDTGRPICGSTLRCAAPATVQRAGPNSECRKKLVASR
jgi:hypothetical protein